MNKEQKLEAIYKEIANKELSECCDAYLDSNRDCEVYGNECI